MRRRLFNIAALISLLLCAASIFIWIDSFNCVYDAVYLPVHPRSFEICAERGAVKFSTTILLQEASPDDRRWLVQSTQLGPAAATYLAGLGYADGRFGEFGFHLVRYTTPVYYNTLPAREQGIVLPFWFPVLVFLILPAAWLRRRRIASHRRLRGLCARCGYNLTANTSGICPECGTPVAAPTSS